ncbi:hypothetical protein Ddye_027043 [Dipteronia dyeriana]|uniref:Uncharacterized protein n=1 Tax=Dipteronia dyeriana TaxID=168575 RepID=A0AAD9TP52_9ROSI|nr:hypothetical protein Ddye_027043 [Dipteronia dyeriana]
MLHVGFVLSPTSNELVHVLPIELHWPFKYSKVLRFTRRASTVPWIVHPNAAKIRPSGHQPSGSLINLTWPFLIGCSPLTPLVIPTPKLPLSITSNTKIHSTFQVSISNVKKPIRKAKLRISQFVVHRQTDDDDYDEDNEDSKQQDRESLPSLVNTHSIL